MNANPDPQLNDPPFTEVQAHGASIPQSSGFPVLIVLLLLAACGLGFLALLFGEDTSSKWINLGLAALIYVLAIGSLFIRRSSLRLLLLVGSIALAITILKVAFRSGIR